MTLPSQPEAGSIARLPEVLRELCGELEETRVALFTGGRSYDSLPGRSTIESALAPMDVKHLSGFRSNPCLEDLQNVRTELEEHQPELVVAVGGGTVMDIAKLYLAFREGQDLHAGVRGEAPISTGPLPFVAVPTTSGSGSEATHFAVVYDGHQKFSVAHASLKPTAAIVDAELTSTMGPVLTAHCGLDALCQGIESLWSVHATEESSVAAEEAIRLAWSGIGEAVHDGSPESRARMARASWLAGTAIDRTKTTAPHALSYTLTAQFGVPHGLAVAVLLAEILPFNADVTDDTCMDPRGAESVRERIGRVLQILEADDPEAGRERFQACLRSLSMPATLEELGICTPDDRETLIRGVNAERLRNNPRRLGELELRELFVVAV